MVAQVEHHVQGNFGGLDTNATAEYRTRAHRERLGPDGVRLLHTTTSWLFFALVSLEWLSTFPQGPM